MRTVQLDENKIEYKKENIKNKANLNLIMVDSKDEETVYLENSPIRLVRHTVSMEDEPMAPTLTFRVYVIGSIFTTVLAIVNQYFYFRKYPFVLTSVVVMVLTYPLGKIMELLPNTIFKLGKYKFSFNPGPFHIKEHGLIMMLASGAGNWPYGILMVSSFRLQWGVELGVIASTLLVLATQCMGFGVGGMLIKLVVNPANMFWPTTLVSITLLRAIHETDNQSESKFRIFSLVTIISGLFYLLPGYFFQVLAAIPILCFISNSNSNFIQQLGNPIGGLGLGTISFDWTAITSNLGSPLVTPFYISCNIMAGFILVVWILAPLGYFTNIWDTQSLPISGFAHYDLVGNIYNVSQIINSNSQLDLNLYQNYGPPQITWLMALSYAAGFAALSAILSHFGLHHGHNLYKILKSQSFFKPDIHYKLMERYPKIPNWWFICLSLICLIVTIIIGESNQIQLPWFGVLISFFIGILFAIPNAVLYALTSQFISIHLLAELFGGWIFPGLALGNMLFKTISFLTCYQAVSILFAFKLGHYLKIPPLESFIATLLGTILAAGVSVFVAYYIMDSVPNLCDVSINNNPWSCDLPKLFYDASVLWGLIGPIRLFTDTPYFPILYSFIIGFILPFPFYYLQSYYPSLKLVNIPTLLGGVSMLPPAYPFQYPAWFVIAFLFNHLLFKYRFLWWSRYNYTLSAGLDFGTALSFFIIYALSHLLGDLDWWGNSSTDICNQ